MKKAKRKLTLLIGAVLVALFLFAACGKGSNDEATIPPPDIGGGEQEVQPPESARYVVQALTNLNVRSAPNINSNSTLGMLYTGQTVPLIDKYNEQWYSITFRNQLCYISTNASYTTVIDTQANPTSQIENVISQGMKQLSVPYEFGATRILSWDYKENAAFTGKTFDCSSFVQFAFYRGAGVALNANTRTQVSQGKEIPHAQIQRGDVLFMTSSSRLDNVGIERIGHVAIYLGNEQILHTFGTGGVVVQPYSAFWKGRFIVAKRMI